VNAELPTFTFNAAATHQKFQDLAELRAFASRLIALWDKDREKTWEIKNEYRESGPLILSYTQHVVELLRTTLQLSTEDRMVIALPLIRLTVENTMTAVWAYLAPSTAARAIIREGFRLRRAAIDDILKVGSAGFDETDLQKVEAELNEFDADKATEAQKFRDLCDRIEGGLGIYATWRILSSYSHAGMQLADHYLAEVPRSHEVPDGVVFNPDAKLDAHEAWLGTAICMLIASMKLCNEIEAKGRTRTQIEKAARRMGISLDFALKT
jgi:hypothetical protein